LYSHPHPPPYVRVWLIWFLLLYPGAETNREEARCIARYSTKAILLYSYGIELTNSGSLSEHFAQLPIAMSGIAAKTPNNPFLVVL
jgi:hypothetical protein